MFVVSLFTSFLYLIRHYGIAFRYLRFTLHSWTSSNNVEVFIATPEFFDPNEVKNETAPWTLDETRGNVNFFFVQLTNGAIPMFCICICKKKFFRVCARQRFSRV